MTDVVLVAPPEGDADLDRLADELGRQQLRVRRVGAPPSALAPSPDGEGLALVCDAAGAGGFDRVRALTALCERGAWPLLVLTGTDDLVGRVVALELGADDAVSRPWSAREVALRVRALVSRWHPQPVAEMVRFGPLALDPELGRARVGERELALSPLEARLLLHLARRGGRVSRDELEARLWGTPAGGRRRLDTVVKRLRHRLRGTGVSVATLRSAGFRLELADLSPLGPAPSPHSTLRR